MNHEYDEVEVPDEGDRITLEDGTDDEIDVPETPIIPILYGDGIGEDIAPAAQRVLEAAGRATGRDVSWMRVYGGESAREKYGEEIITEDTLWEECDGEQPEDAVVVPSLSPSMEQILGEI